jgi:DNA-binding GntR family transcriptional regulator
MVVYLMSRFPSKPIERRSLGDLVYERLALELTEGRYGCGDELNEVALAEHFRVSRTPVRDALRRLAAEGLVVNSRNHRATVIEPTRREIEETYQVRQVLESAAARLAATRIVPARVVELRALAGAAVPPPGETWGAPELTFDVELHRAIAEACGNTCLREEIERYGRLVRFVRSQVARDPVVLRDGHDQHLRLLEALEARDPEAAATAMEVHIAAALGSVLEGLASGFTRPKATARSAGETT